MGSKDKALQKAKVGQEIRRKVRVGDEIRGKKPHQKYGKGVSQYTDLRK